MKNLNRKPGFLSSNMGEGPVSCSIIQFRDVSHVFIGIIIVISSSLGKTSNVSILMRMKKLRIFVSENTYVIKMFQIFICFFFFKLFVMMIILGQYSDDKIRWFHWVPQTPVNIPWDYSRETSGFIFLFSFMLGWWYVCDIGMLLFCSMIIILQ